MLEHVRPVVLAARREVVPENGSSLHLLERHRVVERAALEKSFGDPTVGGDFFWARDDELDISARYSITKNLEAYVDLSNLLNGPGRRFAGIDARTIERETFGRRYTGGFRFTY